MAFNEFSLFNFFPEVYILILVEGTRIPKGLLSLCAKDVPSNKKLTNMQIYCVLMTHKFNLRMGSVSAHYAQTRAPQVYLYC